MTSTMETSWAGRVYRWAVDRNLIYGSTPAAQLGKLIEECGELQIAIAAGDRNGMRDAVGDCSVVLRIIAGQLGIDWTQMPNNSVRLSDGYMPYFLRAIAGLSANLNAGRDCTIALSVCMDALAVFCAQQELCIDECLEQAWEEIKDRKGQMVDGVFVKEA